MNHFPLLTLLFPTLLFAASPLCDGKAVGVPWNGTTVNTDWYTANPAADDFVICTAEELAGLAQLVNNNNNFSGKTINLTADIDLGGKNWTPIGNNGTRFRGTFDGQSNVISGLSVSGGDDTGLFGMVQGGEIRNVGVIGDVSGGTYVGGLVGYAISGATISNSYSIGDVSGTGDEVGGLVGCASGTTISNSYSIGNVSGTGDDVGGLVGLAYGTTTISNSYSIGDVSGSRWVGGLMGWLMMGATISNSYSISDRYVGYEKTGGTITSIYSNYETSDYNGYGKSTAEMKTQSTYEGWDFTDTWIIDPSINHGFPALRSLLESQRNLLTVPTITIANQRLKYGTLPTTIVLHTGSPIEPTVESVSLNGKQLTAGTDYEVSYSNNTAISTFENPAKIIIKGKGEYTGTSNFKFYITEPRDLAAGITVDPIPDQIETGSNINYKPVVKDYSSWGVLTEGGIVVLTEGLDYSLYYENNRNPGTATITILGRGIYDLTSREATFKIVPAIKLTTANTTIAYATNHTYSGDRIMPPVTVTYTPESKILEAGKDYSLEYGDNTNAGTNVGTITVRGTGNYIDAITRTFTITPKPLSSSMASPIEPQKYEGNPIEPEVTLTDNGKKLLLGKDYSVRYLSNNEPGAAQIRIEGAGNYAATPPIFIGFEIYEGHIEKIPVAVVWQGPFEFEYNSQQRCPHATATLPGGQPLALSISCPDAVNARDNSYTATATYPYSTYELQNHTATFKINRAPITATLHIPNINEGQTLARTISGTKETGAVSYWYSKERSSGYTQNIPSAEGVYHAYAVISQTTNYLGTTTDTVSFSIYKTDPAKVTVSWSGPFEFTYNGEPQSPGASASYFGTPFPVSVSGATEAGFHIATAKLQNERTDYKLDNPEIPFIIRAKSLAIDAIEPIGNFFYTGLQIKPENIEVRDGSKVLEKDIDYSIAYGDNISEMGVVYATGKGNYAGTVSRHFPISSEDAAVVSVVWSGPFEFEYNGELQAPAATASNLELVIIGVQTNAGSHTAVAQLKNTNQGIILANATMPYTITPKPVTVSWTKLPEYVYNKNTQGPTATLSDPSAEFRIANIFSGAGNYTAANNLAPYIQLIGPSAGNYKLSNYTTDYEILKKDLKPYFSTTLPAFKYSKENQTLEVPSEVFTDKDALTKILESIIAYDGFATDSKGESDNESVLKGKNPAVEIDYAAPTLSKRVETTQKATATIVTDGIEPDNYALTRPVITIIEIADDEAELIFCRRGSYCTELSEEVCLFVGGTEIASCNIIRTGCQIDESRCVSNMLLASCNDIGGEPIESCSMMSPIMPHIPFSMSYVPSYYNLKGQPLGMQKPTIPGVYIEKAGKQARKVLVK